jgi:hypothetical protein
MSLLGSVGSDVDVGRPVGVLLDHQLALAAKELTKKIREQTDRTA